MERLTPTMTRMSFLQQLDDMKKTSLEILNQSNKPIELPPVITNNQPTTNEPEPAPAEPVKLPAEPIVDKTAEPAGESLAEEAATTESFKPGCKTCQKILAVANGDAGHVTSASTVVEHFVSDNEKPLDKVPRNKYTKLDNALTKFKKNIKKEKFCNEHWHDIASAIVVLIVVIFFTIIIQVFTGAIKLCTGNCKPEQQTQSEYIAPPMPKPLPQYSQPLYPPPPSKTYGGNFNYNDDEVF